MVDVDGAERAVDRVAETSKVSRRVAPEVLATVADERPRERLRRVLEEQRESRAETVAFGAEDEVHVGIDVVDEVVMCGRRASGTSTTRRNSACADYVFRKKSLDGEEFRNLLSSAVSCRRAPGAFDCA